MSELIAKRAALQEKLKAARAAAKSVPDEPAAPPAPPPEIETPPMDPAAAVIVRYDRRKS